jgi:DNA-binding response OmpR family regulator
MSDREKHCLIVEDETAVQTLLQSQLSARGFKVTVANDGLDGLMKLENIKPDVILCDVMMPKLDGFAFIRAIKARNQTRQIPVIVISAKSDPRAIIDGINAGARFYMTKPVKLDELIAKLDRALSDS